MTADRAGISRRTAMVMVIAALGACATAAEPATYTMYRDPQCGCCEDWVEHIRSSMAVSVSIVDATDMDAIKEREGVPADLRSCHTMLVNGYAIEGHVPASDIARLLRERPAGVRGLAVPGMPLGSPGMEMGGRKQPYQVIAFGPAGRRVFASY